MACHHLVKAVDFDNSGKGKHPPHCSDNIKIHNDTGNNTMLEGSEKSKKPKKLNTNPFDPIFISETQESALSAKNPRSLFRDVSQEQKKIE